MLNGSHKTSAPHPKSPTFPQINTPENLYVNISMTHCRCSSTGLILRSSGGGGGDPSSRTTAPNIEDLCHISKSFFYSLPSIPVTRVDRD
ncbi:hypothetical protein E2C01_094600 [Portunus trituberculatus]|uniref:Uncharacterized protein n=1 Tax=Portunus trituberculatus TaxID=210409 RepID=A0A5B7JMJ7_PORTR|nr:hypothetical protein [Portunus trituberculatus]